MSFPVANFVGRVPDVKDSKNLPIETGYWSGGVLADDGCIYAAPFNALQILKIDPKGGTTELVGDKIPGREKYHGGVLANGFVYFVPHNAEQILKFNTKTKHVEFVGSEYAGDKKWHGAAMGKDGCMYCAPYKQRNILKLDPNDNNRTSLDYIVEYDYVDDDDASLYSGCVAYKAFIYFIPFDSKNILKYEVDSEQCSRIALGNIFASEGWKGGVLGPDNCIYGIPHKANQILRYDPSNLLTIFPTLLLVEFFQMSIKRNLI